MAQHKPFTIPIDPAKATSLFESLQQLGHVKTAGNKLTIHDQTTGQVVFHAELQALITPVNLPETQAEEEAKRIITQHLNAMSK